MKFRALLLSAGVLLLASCTPNYWMQWNVGECIRHTETPRKGVDVRRPVDGKLYLRAEESDSWVVRAKEVSFVSGSPRIISRRKTWSEFSFFADTEEAKALALSPTGRIVIAEAQCFPNSSDVYFVRELPAIPEGCTDCLPLARDKPQPATVKALGVQSPNSAADWGLTLVAAPFDYLIDPALSLISTGMMLTLEQGIAPVVESLIEQQQAAQELQEN